MPLKKHILLIMSVILSIGFTNAKHHSKKKPSVVNDTLSTKYLVTSTGASLSDSIINYGKLFLRTPYHYGSSGTSSFDCSGFTSHVYRNFGYNLPHSSASQAQKFDSVKRDELKAGDLVYFSGRRGSSRVGHVGIVVSAKENGEFEFIHAAVSTGVTISNSAEAYYTRRFIKANRVIGGNSSLVVVPFVSKNQKLQEDSDVILSGQQRKNLIPAEYHRVKSGETLSSISKKYNITVDELKQINDIKGSRINPRQQLKVRDEKVIVEAELATKNSEKPSYSTKVTKLDLAVVEPTLPDASSATHKVKKGESLFAISKTYHISIDELKKINNLKGTGLRPGQEIKVGQVSDRFVANSEVKSESKSIDTYKVMAGESLYTISKKHNISIEELKDINNLQNGNIRPGQKLKLSRQTTGTSIARVEKPSQITHHVVSGESLYSIAKIYGCTIEEIKEWNHTKKNKLNLGDRLVISPKNS